LFFTSNPTALYVYSAEVLDDPNIDDSVLWTCPHEHLSPGEAYQCAEAWVERVGRARAPLSRVESGGLAQQLI